MNNTNQEVIVIIEKLERYRRQGYMDNFEIGEIISDIKRAYNKDNEARLNKMMDDVTFYMSCMNNDSYFFQNYVRENIEIVSQAIDKSSRTVYRKLQNDSFTKGEKDIINALIKKNA